ncbi:MAG: hypothetical protein BWY42_01263 [Candidatus Omnitrophica bacterium ADurb.Bin277]|nr:MAG: hypothetical protein BWY42_01263 [Candidatus Omnitrophica bacterium ADurb.Bin277]
MNFNPYIPLETKLRAFKLHSSFRKLNTIRACSYCGQLKNVNDLDDQSTCASCRVHEFGKGE